MSISEKKYNDFLKEYLLLKLDEYDESHKPYIEELTKIDNITSYFIFNISKILNMNMTWLNREIEEFLEDRENKILEHMIMKYFSEYKLVNERLVDSNNNHILIKHILRDTSEIFNKPIEYVHPIFMQYLNLNSNLRHNQNARKLYSKLYGSLNTSIIKNIYDNDVDYRREIIKKLYSEIMCPGLDKAEELSVDGLHNYKYIILLMQEFGFVEQNIYTSASLDSTSRFVPFHEEF